MAIKLSIGRRFSGVVESLEAAQIIFCKMREESGEGASTFPDGKINADGKVYRISYNGRLWEGTAYVPGAEPVANAPAYSAYA